MTYDQPTTDTRARSARGGRRSRGVRPARARRRSAFCTAAALVVATGVAVLGGGRADASATAGFTHFSYVVADQSFTVPAAVTAVVITAVGGSGGSGSQYAVSGAGSSGGASGTATAAVAVAPGEVLTVDVGGKAHDGDGNGSSVSTGSHGIGGGGGAGDGFDGDGGGGGGGTKVQGPGVLVVAGGGVGGGGGGGGGAGSSLVQGAIGTPTFATSNKIGDGSVTISWSAPTPTVTLSASANPSHGAVTFTATVAPPAGVATAATGPVLFDIDGAYAGQGTLSGGTTDTATLSRSSLTAGAHTVEAVYEGDSVYGVANSAILHQTSVGATSLALAATPNPVLAGQVLRLSATVTPLPAGPAPTGTVRFCAGTQCYTASLNGATPDVATISTSAALLGLGTGTGSVSATYGGSGTYSGSPPARSSR